MSVAPHAISAAEIDFTRLVRPGDTVVWTHGAGEPLELLERLLSQRHAIGRFRVFLAGSYAGALRPEHADLVEIFGLGAVGANRALCDAGAMQVIPGHFSDLPRLMREGHLRPDVVLAQLSAENARGELSWGGVNGFAEAAIPQARTVVGQLNDAVPWTRSRQPVDRAALDVVTRVSRPLVEVPAPELSETERAIATHVATFVEDGATVQLGIGAVPSAVAQAIGDRRDLGVHSGVVGDALVDLIESGAITNRRKPLDTGVSVTGALVGTRRLHAFAHENPDLLVEPISYTHDQRVLERMTGLVAINSAVEVDLTGQVGAEVAATRYVGTVGGQTDFVRGALAAERGRSVIALSSRTRRGTSKIVARLGSGVVTTSRADADVVATEYGAAELRGQPIPERVRRMVAIAHPADREALEREAHEHVVGFR
jgi:acyl-CoA hydrolase